MPLVRLGDEHGVMFACLAVLHDSNYMYSMRCDLESSSGSGAFCSAQFAGEVSAVYLQCTKSGAE